MRTPDRGTPLLPPRARYHQATPASPEGLEAWRKALRSNRKSAEAELPDVTKFITLWYAERPSTPVGVEELVRLALREKLLPHTLRGAILKTRCARMAEVLGRVLIAQGKAGLAGCGYRIARATIDKNSRGWIVRTSEEADRVLEELRQAEIEAEKQRDAAVAERRRVSLTKRHIVRR